MNRKLLIFCLANCFCFWLCLFTGQCCGQQINLASPFHSTNSSFYENHGVSFGFNFPGGSGNGTTAFGQFGGGSITPNIGFNQNNSGATIPAFGGFDPSSSARFGFGRRSPNGGGFSLGFNLAKGSNRTQTSITPSLTLPNGGFGSFSSGQIRPFVTSVVPVVGIDNGVTRGIASGQLKPYDPSRSERRSRSQSGSESKSSVASRQSSAMYGDESVASIKAAKALRAIESKRQIEACLALATTAESSEDYRNARINLRAAIKLTEDPTEKKELRKRLFRLSGK